MSFWGLWSLLLAVFFCALLSLSTSCVLFPTCLSLFFCKDSAFQNDSQHNNRNGAKTQSAKVCFSTLLTCLWQRCSLMRGWKSSRSWSGACLSLMISTWHPHPPPAFQLSPESTWSYYHPCPCGILLNIHHSSYEPLIIIASFCFRLK